jgi:hypothetical protein
VKGAAKPLTGRVALEDIDDVGGKRIPKGEGVLCLLGSANRDPAVYPDRPDRLDITREDAADAIVTPGHARAGADCQARPRCLPCGDSTSFFAGSATSFAQARSEPTSTISEPF